jgi:ubiquinone/menaquinone biosynthesis C-methylase UbiE
MNNILTQLKEQSGATMNLLIDPRISEEKTKFSLPPQIPDYLEKVYWWAYVRPYAIKFFDRPWIVNLILFGNMAKLRDKALDALGTSIHGCTLQIASVYGDYALKMVERIADGGSLDIVDVVPAQLNNLRNKLPHLAPVRLIQNDASDIQLEDASYDNVVLFFLLHEMPADFREKTLREAVRLLKPKGRLVIVDYHKPLAWNPFRYFFPFLFRALEPFALDIWKNEIEEWLPTEFTPKSITKETLFGGVYQKVVIDK